MLSAENLKNIKSNVLNRRGLILFSTFSFLSYVLLVLVNNFSLVYSYIFNFNVLLSVIPSLVLGYQGSVSIGPFSVVLLTSIMIGLNLTLLSQSLSFDGLSAAPGSLMGLTVSGCAACTTGVIGIAGFSIGLGFLPHNGLEIGALGVGILFFSALYISEKERQKTCKVN